VVAAHYLKRISNLISVDVTEYSEAMVFISSITAQKRTFQVTTDRAFWPATLVFSQA
jgi:hypothetical protein